MNPPLIAIAAGAFKISRPIKGGCGYYLLFAAYRYFVFLTGLRIICR